MMMKFVPLSLSLGVSEALVTNATRRDGPDSFPITDVVRIADVVYRDYHNTGYCFDDLEGLRETGMQRIHRPGAMCNEISRPKTKEELAADAQAKHGSVSVTVDVNVNGVPPTSFAEISSAQDCPPLKCAAQKCPQGYTLEMDVCCSVCHSPFPWEDKKKKHHSQKIFGPANGHYKYKL